ncbi:MAG: hypothetical protein KGN79_12140 [Acidobacteriota bacterium]|nr:hypothetical protein [Acidobacteriota bacterium]
MARRTSTAIPFAPFEDLHGLQIAIRQVFNMIDNPFADTRRTGQLLYALQLATQVAARIANQRRTPHDCPKCSEALGLPPEAYDLETGSRLDLLPTETKSHPINETLEGIEQHLSKVRK